MPELISIEVITSKIFVIRGKRVMLDRDLAQLYGVTTKRLNEQVKRNIKRFPEDFMLQLTISEKIELVAICDQFNSMKHSTALPYVFTEQGVVMLSGVLNSDRAIARSHPGSFFLKYFRVSSFDNKTLYPTLTIAVTSKTIPHFC